MLNIFVLLRILEYYGIETDITKKIIIEWGKICIAPVETNFKKCLSEIYNPILLNNGGTRWDYRTDFYHKIKKQKKNNGKYRWKKNNWEYWHQNPSKWAPYYKLHPDVEPYNLQYVITSNPLIKYYSKKDEDGNVKCSFTQHVSDYECLKFIEKNISEYGNTDKKFSIYKWDENKSSLKELQSFIFQNLKNNF